MASGPIQTNFNPNNSAEVAKFIDMIKGILKSKVPRSRLKHLDGFADRLVTETKGKTMFMTELEIFDQFNDYVKDITFVPPDVPMPEPGPKKDEGRHEVPGAEPDDKTVTEEEADKAGEWLSGEPITLSIDDEDIGNANANDNANDNNSENPNDKDDEDDNDKDDKEGKEDDSMADVKLTPKDIKDKFGIDVSSDMTIDELVEGIKNKTITISGGLQKGKIMAEPKLYDLYKAAVDSLKGTKVKIHGVEEEVTDQMLKDYDTLSYVVHFDVDKIKSSIESTITANRPDPTTQDPSKSGGSGKKDPKKPDPKKPDPAKPDPAKPDPAKPDPTKPDPSKPDPDKDYKEKEFKQAVGQYPGEFYNTVLEELSGIKLDSLSTTVGDYKPAKGETLKAIKIVKEPEIKNTRVECSDVNCAIGLFEQMLRDIQENGDKSEFYRKKIMFNGKMIPMKEFAARGDEGLEDLKNMVGFIEKNPNKDYEAPARRDTSTPVNEKNATKETAQVLDELKSLDAKTRTIVKGVRAKEEKDVSDKVISELSSEEGKKKFKEDYQELVRFEAMRNKLERIANEVKELEKHPELLETLLASKRKELIEVLNQFNTEFSQEKLEKLYKFKAQLIFVGRANPDAYKKLVPQIKISDDEAKKYQEFSDASKDFVDGVRLGSQIRSFSHSAGGLIPGETGDKFKDLKEKNRETMKNAKKVIKTANISGSLDSIEEKIENHGMLSTIARTRVEDFNNRHIRSRMVTGKGGLTIAPKYDAEMVTAAVKLEQELVREIMGDKDPRKGLDI